jgi:hypothetical protein
LNGFAHIEVYQSQEEALERYEASKAALISRFSEQDAAESTGAFCIAGQSSFWTCISSSGYAYAEVTVTPNANATLGITTGTLSALLRYTDKLTELATSH